jgi:ATP-dependent Lhr-like helicase
MAEHVAGGFAGVYAVLKAFEESGRCRRGYFVEGLGGAQFALPGAVERMRALVERPPAAQGSGTSISVEASFGTTAPSTLRSVGDLRSEQTHVLAASDPANPYGAALPWPERESERHGHRPGRKAGAVVVLVDGNLVVYVEKGGRTLLTYTEQPDLLRPAVDALALAVREGVLGKLAVERADGEAIFDTPLALALAEAGFHQSPRGLRLRG